MIDLRILGTLDLRSPDGVEVRPVLVQPKRLALLVHLAVAAPAGFRRREALLELFWPDLEPSRGRAALRNALHYLRKSLGADVLVNRGDEEVGVDAERIRVDVVAFDRSIGERRYEEALALYRGDLLAGFHLDGAPEFERWLAAERERYRTRAASAAWALSEAAEARGAVREAADRARRAADLDPYSESALRRLLTTLHRLGDRAGAIHAYEVFVQRLESALGVEPSPETRAVVEAVRAESPAAAPAAAGAVDSTRTRALELSRGIAARQSRYLTMLATRVEALTAARDALASGKGEADASIRRIAHALRGSGAIYGYPEVSDAARSVEDAPGEELLPRTNALLLRLEEAIGCGACGCAVVLVIEDDMAIAIDLAERLAVSGREVLVSGTADEAWAILKSREVALVVLDLMLPDTDGRNLLIQLREDPGLAETPVVVVSAMSGRQPRTECLALGADAYFEKPYDVGALVASVAGLLHAPRGAPRLV